MGTPATMMATPSRGFLLALKNCDDDVYGDDDNLYCLFIYFLLAAFLPGREGVFFSFSFSLIQVYW
jgi:hypothetical protein